MLIRLYKISALIFGLALRLVARDFDDVLKAVHLAWPEMTKGAIICNADSSSSNLVDLTNSAKAAGISLVILNVKSARELDRTVANLLSRKLEFLLLLEGDPILGLHSENNTKRILAKVQTQHIPSVAISEAALQVGVLLVAGPSTKGKVLVNSSLALQMEYSLPVDFQMVDVK